MFFDDDFVWSIVMAAVIWTGLAIAFGYAFRDRIRAVLDFLSAEEPASRRDAKTQRVNS